MNEVKKLKMRYSLLMNLKTVLRCPFFSKCMHAFNIILNRIPTGLLRKLARQFWNLYGNAKELE